jgi:hypothetical protein
VSLDSANRQTIDGGASVEPVQRQRPEGGPEHEQRCCGPAADGAGEAAVEEVAAQVEEKRGAAGASEIRVRHGELLPELRRRPRLYRPSLLVVLV